MSEINAKAIESLSDRLKIWKKDLKLQKTFPDIPLPPAKWILYYAWGDSIKINMPLDFEAANAYKETLEKNGWTFLEDYSNLKKQTEKAIIGRFRKKLYSELREQDISFDFSFELVSWMDGGTCVKKQIGVETIEQPIYEIVCKEGLEEADL